MSMWGSSFADLAKKAQELQEQASEAASTFSVPAAPNSLFSLDSMQHGLASGGEQQATESTTTSVSGSAEAAVTTNGVDHTTASAATSGSALAASGDAAAAVLGAAGATTTTTTGTTTTIDTTDEDDDKDGWDVDEADWDAQDGGGDAAASVACSSAEAVNNKSNDTTTDSSGSGKASKEEENGVDTTKTSVDATTMEAAATSVVEGVVVDKESDTSSLAVGVGEISSVTTTEGASADVAATAVDGAHEKLSVVGEEDVVIDPADGDDDENKDKTVTEITHGEKIQSAEFNENVQQEKTADNKADQQQQPPPAQNEDAEVIPYPEPEVAPTVPQQPPQKQSRSFFNYLPVLQASSGHDRSGKDTSSSSDVDTEASAMAAKEARAEEFHRVMNAAAASSSTASDGGAVPDHVLEQFTGQMARLEENYQAERREIEQRHMSELRDARNQASSERSHMEDQHKTEIRKKDQDLFELRRANEGFQLKLETLKRELAGTKDMLDARDTEKSKASETFLQNLRSFERKAVEAEQKAAKANDEVQRLQNELDATKANLGASIKEHTDLLERVKGVANELKERRMECRELHTKNEEAAAINMQLQEQVTQLEAQLSNQDRSGTEKDEEINALHSKLDDAAKEIQRVIQAGKVRDGDNDRALSDYKKKAQASLSLANSRTAAAVHAKEEAEMEARAARSTADTAMSRAVAAELSSKEAQAEAKAAVMAKERERAEAVQRLQEMQSKVSQNEEQKQQTQRDLQNAQASKEKLSVDLHQTRSDLREAQSRLAETTAALSISQEMAEGLRTEVTSLKDQLKQVEEAADKQKSNENSALKAVTRSALEKASDRATINTLQQELREANEAIDGLKEALKNAVEEKESSESALHNSADGLSVSGGKNSAVITNGGGGGSSEPPLLYAMEKQAELNTARAEINRLANMLSDVQADKTSAEEAVEAMRKEKNETEARFERFKNLAQGPVLGGQGADDTVHTRNGADSSIEPMPSNRGAVNIEYLKNIMLSYLNAKTLAERKGLLPVIAAVLCLTPDEQNAALQNVVESASVSTSLFDTFKFS